MLRAARDESTRADCGAILQYIQQNYRTVRLSTLARAFHYNETYLSRMLQNYMGMSFTEIVRGIKMTRAEEYLSTSTLRIHDISALVGYDSVDHFLPHVQVYAQHVAAGLPPSHDEARAAHARGLGREGRERGKEREDGEGEERIILRIN